eukprot:CAMPEP_0177513906 /NCGR_PEP_ID=MMETSP0369-20130122/44023_1 /TAXON_ID=447022 ORGANISM="Scrippsiella hangoei-like, Strain SHHI-4" /NCGR_SAMPLE_ID=MMETSP0369 /ASSEMBLY_ACC=CAM_ASM_000364 /LENGTH=730 /DNA_ID=CAMNT_0018992541 /DNA_START=51 /DNA_END=2242 /DNA_ORIENTATION=+
MAKRLLLLAAWAVAGTASDGNIDIELRERLADLERLVRNQQELIQGQQQKLQTQESRLNDMELHSPMRSAAERRLAAALPPSIYGDVPNISRAYTSEESLQGALSHVVAAVVRRACGSLLFGAAAVAFASGLSDPQTDALLEQLKAFEAEFGRYKETSALELRRAKKQSAIEQGVLTERLAVLEATERRRLHINEAEADEKIAWNEGNWTANAAAIADLQSAADHTWLILCGSLVMFMQAGFAMVEAGCCRAKNVQNILLKNLFDVCIGTLGWWALGWSIAYGRSEVKSDILVFGEENGLKVPFNGHTYYVGNFGGTGFMSAYSDGREEPSDKMMNWFFQWAFCSAAATIVSGGVAERVNFMGYALFSVLMTGIIYPVVVASTWGGGWLAEVTPVGYMDFAGSGVVHMAGGVGALVGALCAGPRIGRWEHPEKFVPHSLPLVVLGTFILWFGWYGFNCGSTLSMKDIATGMLAAQVAMNTTLAAATGGITVFLMNLRWKYDIGSFCNGILAGLVSITAPCGNVACGSAVLIGMYGGVLYQLTSWLMKRLRIDDPVDAFAVHGMCGAWGVLAAVFFDWGLGFDKFHGWKGFDCVKDDGGQCMSGAWKEALSANLLEILFVVVWVGLSSACIFLPLRLAGLLRASESDQLAGFDEVKHSPSKAYTWDAQSQEVVPSSPGADLGAMNIEDDLKPSSGPRLEPMSPHAMLNITRAGELIGLSVSPRQDGRLQSV